MVHIATIIQNREVIRNIQIAQISGTKCKAKFREVPVRLKQADLAQGIAAQDLAREAAEVANNIYFSSYFNY
jgi:hypothetical protein